MVDLCQLSADEGPCDEFQTAFYYSAKVDRCEQFTWGGCGGNANRFASREDCEKRCRQQNTIRRPPTAQHDGKEHSHIRTVQGHINNIFCGPGG